MVEGHLRSLDHIAGFAMILNIFIFTMLPPVAPIKTIHGSEDVFWLSISDFRKKRRISRKTIAGSPFNHLCFKGFYWSSSMIFISFFHPDLPVLTFLQEWLG